jgi:hypothetical protein
MAYIKDRALKQIATNIVDQSNVPNVPPHLQTANYYPQGTTNTPPPMGNAFVSGPQGPQIYNNQMGMSNQMGTYPTQQSGGSKDKTLLTTPMTDEQKKKYDAAVNAYKDSTESWIQGKGPEPTPPDYTSFKNIPMKQTAELDDKKKIHLGHDWDARSQSTTDVFIKGARVKDGVTTEKGKKVRYHRSPDMGTPENPKSHLGDHDPIYTKEIYKKKKGAEAGFETWEKKGEKQISKKKFDRQIKRKSKRYGDIIAHVS